MPNDATHILINALSATAPGGFTVARNLASHLGAARPAWRFTLVLIEGVPMHDQLRADDLGSNVELLRAPAAEALRRVRRARYESGPLAALARERGVNLVLQLNGIPPRGMDLPIFCHNQDPWPYRPQAWDMGWSDRLLALLRRRAQKRGLKRADTVGFTSKYLRDLMIGWQGVTPRRSGVYYNGLPQKWIDRAAEVDALTSPWADRPMEILSVSAVGRYKRQELVIRALPQLI